MKIYLGTDHAGFKLKNKIKEWLGEWGHDVEDMGAHDFHAADDYPDFIKPVAEAVSKDPQSTKGIILGGSGQGEAMAANRYKNVRAAVYYGGPLGVVQLSREHNDANVLSLAARFLDDEQAKQAVKLWLETEFAGEERHKRRIKKIDE